MKCPNCSKKMRQINRYKFQGWKHGVPGERLSYFCRHCGQKIHYLLFEEGNFEKIDKITYEYKMEVLDVQRELREITDPLEFNRILRQGKCLQEELSKFLKRIGKYW